MRKAQHWMARLHSHEVDAADAERLREWRRQSAEHELAFAEANLQWSLLRSAALNLVEQNGREMTQPKPAAAHRLTRRMVLGGAVVASCAGAAYVAANPPLHLWPSAAEMLSDYRTRTGEQRQFTLAGAVSVEMNTQTSLSVHSEAPGGAALEVISGEIAVSATSPVQVISGNGRSRADQAQFSVRNLGDKVAVNCFEGRVKVNCGGAELELGAGRGVIYERRGLEEPVAVDMTTVEAWRRGLLIFVDAPLAAVIDEINRYRNGRVFLLDSTLRSLSVDATFRLDRIDEAVFRLADVFRTKVRTLPGGVVLFG
jgi:transmembrane sensor